MKKNKSQRKETFMDALLELVITLVLFGLGALVLALFGIGVDAVDGDLVMLIGIGVLSLLGGVIWGVSILAKKKKANGNNDGDDTPSNH